MTSPHCSLDVTQMSTCSGLEPCSGSSATWGRSLDFCLSVFPCYSLRSEAQVVLVVHITTRRLTCGGVLTRRQILRVESAAVPPRADTAPRTDRTAITTMQVASLRPALLFWATALRPLPLHPLMTADNVPPVRAAAPIVSSAPKPDGSGSQLVPKVDEELLAQVSQSLPHP